ncbi:CopY family transcriptional regulator [Salinisphaera sp. PC39]
MEHLWESGPADVKAVHAVLGRDQRRSLNTVQSTLDRLFRKQLLRREKVSRAYVYTPAIEREALLVEAMGQIAERLGARDSGAFMASFVKLAEQDDPDNLDRLQRLIDAQRVQRDSDE